MRWRPGSTGMLVLAALFTFVMATGTWADRSADKQRGTREVVTQTPTL